MRRSHAFRRYGYGSGSSGNYQGQHARNIIRRITENSINNVSIGTSNHHELQDQNNFMRNTKGNSFNDFQSLHAPPNHFDQRNVHHNKHKNSQVLESKREVRMNKSEGERLSTRPIPGLLDLNLGIPVSKRRVYHICSVKIDMIFYQDIYDSSFRA
jgi:hypothetical protein